MNQNEYKKKELKKILNLIEVKKYGMVIAKAKPLINKFPKEYIFYNALGMALINSGRFKESLEVFNDAIKLDEKNIYVLNNLGLAHGYLANYKQSEEYYNRALEIKPDFLNSLINLAYLKEVLNLNNESIKILKTALNYYPNDYFLHYTIATVYQFLGDFKNSHLHYNKSLSLNPKQMEIYRLMSMTKKFKEDDKDFDFLKKMINDKNLDETSKMHLYFALGKAFDDVKDFDNSFLNYKKGNDIKDKLLKFKLKPDETRLINIKNSFVTKFNNLSLQNKIDKNLIFIVGMTRSGTTLIEQVLSAHDDVTAAGELPFLVDAIDKEFKKKENVLDLNEVSEKNLVNIQNYYLGRIKEYNFSEKFIIDKAPLNFKWVGFIKKVFPNSYIINCNRDPMDICWSNYKQYYSSNNLGFAYNLKNIANFYNLYEEFMKFWQSILDEEGLLSIKYEIFTENFEEEVKKLLKFCNLEWNEKCIEFYKNKSSVSTASLAQVRQPIYKTSVAAWENYSSYLEDLKNTLKNY